MRIVHVLTTTLLATGIIALLRKHKMRVLCENLTRNTRRHVATPDGTLDKNTSPDAPEFAFFFSGNTLLGEHDRHQSGERAGQKERDRLQRRQINGIWSGVQGEVETPFGVVPKGVAEISELFREFPGAREDFLKGAAQTYQGLLTDRRNRGLG